VLAHLSKETEYQRDVVMAEMKSEHWLAACWRPLLMLVLTGFLILIGFFIPLADLIAGHAIRYEPRWQQLPVGFWDFLSIGVGGYIGGRSLEKITGQVFGGMGRSKK
jgi:Holin of 3TMs, for gene-transfer release